jgi:RecJ-like exonuclease
VIVLLIALAGCVATLPDDATISADLACETARAIVQLRARPSVPDDKPKPGDKCHNCEGRGYVGDGVVKVKCQPCGGTGKVLATANACPDGRCQP